MDTLVIKELTFSAAHYLPGHPKCGVIHGHTYFVRNLLVDCEQFVDLGDIKAAIQRFDHKLLVPKEHLNFWLDKFDYDELNIKCGVVTTDGWPTVENIHREVEKVLTSVKGVLRVRFELYEGPNQGVTDFDS